MSVDRFLFRRRILRVDIKPDLLSFEEKFVSSRSSWGYIRHQGHEVIRKTKTEKGTKAEGWMFSV